MRIDGSQWASQVATRVSGGRGGAALAFALPSDPPVTSRPASTQPALALCDLQALIALQAFEEPKERRKKAVKRGFDLLDVLEGVKLDLLVGRIEVDRLERLVSMLGNKVETGDSELDGLMEEIDLRARVELAKLGRYPD